MLLAHSVVEGKGTCNHPVNRKTAGPLGPVRERDQVGIYVLEVSALSCLGTRMLSCPKHRAWLTLLLQVEPCRLPPAYSEGGSQEMPRNSLNVQDMSRSSIPPVIKGTGWI